MPQDLSKAFDNSGAPVHNDVTMLNAFQSSKNEKITLPHEFSFVFIQYFNRATLSEKPCQKWGVLINIKRKGWPYRGGGVYRRGPSAHYTGLNLCKKCVCFSLFLLKSRKNNFFSLKTEISHRKCTFLAKMCPFFITLESVLIFQIIFCFA